MSGIRASSLAALLCLLSPACGAPAPAADAAPLPVSAPLTIPAASAPRKNIAASSATAPPNLPAATPPAAGLGACDPLPIECVRSIASRQQDDRTIVYITPAAHDLARPGQWVHCQHKDRPPSPPCQVLDIVDSGMLEASCHATSPICPPATPL